MLNAYRYAMLGIAALLGLAGFAYFLASLAKLSTALETDQGILFGLLLLASILCTRFPLRLGLHDSYITLDSIPMALSVLLLPTAHAVTVGVLTTAAAMVGMPSPDEGWRRTFWRIQTPFSRALAIGGACAFASSIPGISDTPDAVLIVPAFLVALALEVLLDLFVFVEAEAHYAGAGLPLLRLIVVPLLANVFLSTMAAAVLTPYSPQPWLFAALLAVLLVCMYGALWVANSQQLEKRRGDRLKDTFGRYVPEGIVDDNIESMQQIELGGEQHDLSVLFCDIRGFTTWAEDKGATEVINELNALLTELSASVMSTGGTLDKFTGDGLMAFWGAPVPVEDHADRACRAALNMLQRLEAVNGRRQEQGQEPFRIGVAVHSGMAVVGNVGHERRLDYTAIGDTVNTTARLEASTKDLGAVLLVSRDTVDALSGELRERAMLVGDVTMKGKARPVEAWALQPLRPELDDVDDEFAA